MKEEWAEWAAAAQGREASASVMRADTANRTSRASPATRINVRNAETSWQGGSSPQSTKIMLRTILKSKIHRVSLTGVHLDYEGSIGIDKCFLAAADIQLFELVHVFNVNNGARFQTYAINAQRDSGAITLNGAAAC
jgi:hypothetical protein